MSDAVRVLRAERGMLAARRLLAVDRLLLGTLAALGAVAAYAHPSPGPFLGIFAVLATFVVVTSWLAPSSRAADLVHAFGPALVLVGIFETVGDLVGVANPQRWDAFFAALDLRLLGPVAPAWRGLLGRPAWLSDALSVCYVSYYVLPLGLGGWALARGRRAEFERYAFALVVTFVASYAGYFLFPTSGPRVGPAEAQAVLGGGAASAAVRAFLWRVELNGLDAFPSGHTAVSLVFLWHAWRLAPRARAPLAAIVAGIVVSTVYLSHHYVVDVIAGAGVAAAVLAALGRPHPSARTSSI